MRDDENKHNFNAGDLKNDQKMHFIGLDVKYLPMRNHHTKLYHRYDSIILPQNHPARVRCPPDLPW